MTGSSRVRRLKRQKRWQSDQRRTTAKTAIGYVRVSTAEQASAGHGLDAQERAIRAFAESQGYKLLEVISDAGISGAKKPAERPGFQQILQLAADQTFSVLLVWKFDRLARSLTHAVMTVNELREQFGVVLRSVTEPIDTATPMGETIFAILAGMAAQERRAITERTIAGKREKAGQGGFASGSAPLGYRRDRQGGLEVDDEEAEIVRLIHSLRKQGKTLRDIADALNDQDVPTKRGGRWYAATVRYILDNPKYKGQIEYYFRWEGEAHVVRPGRHEPLL